MASESSSPARPPLPRNSPPPPPTLRHGGAHRRRRRHRRAPHNVTTANASGQQQQQLAATLPQSFLRHCASANRPAGEEEEEKVCDRCCGSSLRLGRLPQHRGCPWPWPSRRLFLVHTLHTHTHTTHTPGGGQRLRRTLRRNGGDDNYNTKKSLEDLGVKNFLLRRQRGGVMEGMAGHGGERDCSLTVTGWCVAEDCSVCLGWGG